MLASLIKQLGKHRIISLMLFVIVFVVSVYAINYLRIQHVLRSDVPKIHHKFVATFTGLRIASDRSYSGCHNESKYGIETVCDRSYSLRIEPTGNSPDDEQRIRQLFEALVSDGWTGGSKPNLYDVIPATNSGDLKLSDSGVLTISAWKSLSGGVTCDINANYVPALPHLIEKNGSYSYQLYCRKTVFDAG